MATSTDFIEYVIEQVQGPWEWRSRKMFGEYMVYINEKPLLLVCDNTVYVKQLEELDSLLGETDIPYVGAKPHYVLDIEDRALCRQVITILDRVTPVAIKKTKKK